MLDGLLWGLREAWDGVRLRDMPDGVRLAAWGAIGFVGGLYLGLLLNGVVW